MHAATAPWTSASTTCRGVITGRTAIHSCGVSTRVDAAAPLKRANANRSTKTKTRNGCANPLPSGGDMPVRRWRWCVCPNGPCAVEQPTTRIGTPATPMVGNHRAMTLVNARRFWYGSVSGCAWEISGRSFAGSERGHDQTGKRTACSARSRCNSHRSSDRPGVAYCDGCGKRIEPDHLLKPGRRVFRDDCRKHGVPQALAAQDYRARKKAQGGTVKKSKEERKHERT